MKDNLFSAVCSNLRTYHVIVTREPLFGCMYGTYTKMPFILFGYQDFEHASYYTRDFSLF
jgi:hypothetical protein